MKKIFLSSLIIIASFSVIVGGTIAFLSDTEFSIGNTFTQSTFQISVNDQLHWTESFTWANAEPGDSNQINLIIKNEGDLPLKLWKILKCLVDDENGIIEPEQNWYDTYNSGQPKNNIESAIIYEMYVDGKLAIAKEAGITMDQIKDRYIGLIKLDQPFDPGDGDGLLYPGDSINVVQKYYLKEDTQNWAQSDKLTFSITIEAREADAPEPLQQLAFMENKNVASDWLAIVDGTMGLLKYDYMAPTFNYDFMAVGLEDLEYQLIYYPDPWGSPKAIVLIGSPVTAVSGIISTGPQSVALGIDLPDASDANYPHAAKIWLVPISALSGINLTWSPDNSHWLFDNWPGLINYKQGDRPNEEIMCDDGDPPAPPTGPQVPEPGDVVINEIMQNPSAVDDSDGEWFEIYNVSGHDLELENCVFTDLGTDDFIITDSNTISVNGYFILAEEGNQIINGGVNPDYDYSGFTLGNTDDEIILTCDGVEIDRVEYDGGPGFPDPTGASMILGNVNWDNNIGANWCVSNSPFGDGDLGTPKTQNDICI